MRGGDTDCYKNHYAILLDKLDLNDTEWLVRDRGMFSDRDIGIFCDLVGLIDSSMMDFCHCCAKLISCSELQASLEFNYSAGHAHTV